MVSAESDPANKFTATKARRRTSRFCGSEFIRPNRIPNTDKKEIPLPAPNHPLRTKFPHSKRHNRRAGASEKRKAPRTEPPLSGFHEEENPINTQTLTARIAAGLAALALVPLAGCGGGSSSSSNNNGSGGSGGIAAPNVSGSVTDINGTPILNATVTFNGNSTTSGQSGQYSLPYSNSSEFIVPVTVSASRVVNGVTWTGSNRFFQTSNTSVPNVQIVISNPATQGTITGTVQKPGATVGAAPVPVPNAKVLLSAAAPSSLNLKFAFYNLGAIAAYTDSSGIFTIPNVPAAANYTIVASYTGQTNGAAQNVTVTAGQTTTQNFTLAAAVGDYNLPAIANFDGISITTPVNPTRAAGSGSVDSGVLAVRDYLLQKRGIRLRRAAADSKIILKTTGATRATPSGYVIQNILEWDYQAYASLYGYAVLRSLNNTDNFQVYADIQDPLAERFSDGDSILTPNSLYYYNIVRIDANQNEGSATGENTVVLRPMNPINPTAPANGSTQSSPTFQWQAVTNAVNYTVVVYDGYPQPADPSTGAAANLPIWPPGSNPTASTTTGTSLLYQGPALVSGHTYYWAVAATDQQDSTAINYDTTISALSHFIAP